MALSFSDCNQASKRLCSWRLLDSLICLLCGELSDQLARGHHLPRPSIYWNVSKYVMIIALCSYHIDFVAEATSLPQVY